MTGGDSSRDAATRAAALIRLFADPGDFGRVVPVPASGVPEPYRGLLDHANHMTVTMERHHGGPVGLRVVATAADPTEGYAREILLTSAAGAVVQFGIVRIDLGVVDPRTADRIRAGATPLGRILVEAGVLCSVDDVALVGVTPGPHLAALIGPRPTYGRVAAIAVSGRPAVELLEIVAAG